MNRVCVIGAGSTKYGRLKEGIVELAVNASRDAIKSAGIEARDVQYAFISNVFGVADRQVHLAPVIMSDLGLMNVPGLTVESACGSGSIAFREAYANVAAGFYDVVLVVGVEKVTHTGTARSTTLFSYCSDFFYEGGSGVSFPGLFASMARAYMNRYGATEEDLAMVAVKNHEHGLLNPKAHIRKRITVGDVLESPPVASPLKLLDCCPFSDGASAVILASEEYAKSHGLEYVQVIGSGRGASPATLQDREDITAIPSTRAAAQQAFKQAGIEPKDVDFAEVHDCFTIAEIVDVEDLGFFPKGKGAEAVKQGVTRLGGDLPINPSGGLKSKGHPIGATGVGQVAEVYEQLLGRAGERQVKGAEIALTHNFGATGASCAVHIFRRV
ncbi:MAG: thiolase domain-containing protein [Candidatus Nitrosocaldus sp.]|nr:thiolase domain-containing protein [Candidatus Nitrosocaldus sp.]MCS7140856.1 thiolase domain-containing protein [Candidatus Nitrosocaldus sp.]MDW7999784.1 thiolase domain-containing protein [Candidatus Nitrosocaldus sp.]MDW8274855.1 thiolase domain-containing protein [Candidatus Nitrosocaldus sp.]